MTDHIPNYIEVDKYILAKKIGKGSFGTVHFAFYKEQFENFVAVKLIYWNFETPERIQRADTQLDKETRFISDITHPHIVKLIGSGLDKTAI